MSDQRKSQKFRLDEGSMTLTFGMAPGEMAETSVGVLPSTMTATVHTPPYLPSITLDIAVRDGEPVCVGVHVTSDDRARDVRPNDVGKLPLAELITEAVQSTAASFHTDHDGFLVFDNRRERWKVGERGAYRERDEPSSSAASAAVRAMRSGSRSAPTREQLEAIAATYQETNGSVQAVMAEHGLTRATAYRWLARARDAELVPPSQRSETMRRGAAMRGKGKKGGK